MRHRGDVYDNVAQYASYLSAMAQIRASATKYNPVKEVSNANVVDESFESFYLENQGEDKENFYRFAANLSRFPFR